ncbi:MAG: hypothetical protein ACYDC6_14010 [Acidobacteriaceae bacterium]
MHSQSKNLKFRAVLIVCGMALVPAICLGAGTARTGLPGTGPTNTQDGGGASAATSATGNQPAMAPTIEASLTPALARVNSAVGQMQVKHWKVSRQAKQQLQNDAASIQQDLSSRLPALLQASQSAPTAMGPQMAVMQNVDALYDVLVRVATTANLTAGKDEAAALDEVLQELEAARKRASDQLLRSVSLQDARVIQLQAAAPSNGTQGSEKGSGKTIVVNNRVNRRGSHPKPPQHKKAIPPPTKAIQPPTNP